MNDDKKYFSSADPFLQGNEFKFNVDNLGRIDNDTYEALLIPDIKSEFFPPFHTRSIKISKKLLEYNFYKDQNPRSDESERDFLNDIKQGAYYIMPSGLFKEKYNGNEGIKIEDRFFKQYQSESSPYKEKYNGDINLTPAEGTINISVTQEQKLEGAILYCFNAGQGDFNLLITSSGNPYIIDTNIYYKSRLDEYIKKIKTILLRHELKDNYIKGLIFTHMHLDHIRGADKLINSRAFNIDYFITNKDYDHGTIVANRLYDAAQKIPNWINSKERWGFQEGGTFICVKNPDNKTYNSPDINNSSISLCIRDNDNLIYLTGDTGKNILENCYQCDIISEKTESVLKVSHHGSHTGTSDEFIKLTNPRYAFVSAGYHGRFNHPHRETINILAKNNVITDISKNVQRDVVYVSQKKGNIKKYYN